ncbi:exocyst complex component 3-like isoform X2 [Lissotriton helveticus]
MAQQPSRKFGKSIKKLFKKNKRYGTASENTSLLLPAKTETKDNKVQAKLKRCGRKIVETVLAEKTRNAKPRSPQTPPGKDLKALLEGNKFLEACKYVNEQEESNSIDAESCYQDISTCMWEVVEVFLSDCVYSHDALIQVVEAVKWEKKKHRESLEKSFDSECAARWIHKEWEAQLESYLKKAIQTYIPLFPSGNRTLSEHLRDLEIYIDSKVGEHGPFLKEVGLLVTYIKCFDICIFDHLEAVLTYCNEYGKCALLYLWVTKHYKRKFMGFSDLHVEILEAQDPSLHSTWTFKAEKKFLKCVTDWRRDRLNRVLGSELSTLHNQTFEKGSEIFLEIFQILITTVEDMQEMADSIIRKVQDTCWEDLHWFINRYAEDLKTELQKEIRNSGNMNIVVKKILRNSHILRTTKQNLTERNTPTEEMENILNAGIQKIEVQGAQHLLSTCLPVIKSHLSENCTDFRWLRTYLEENLNVLDVTNCEGFVKTVHHRACMECLRAFLMTTRKCSYSKEKDVTSVFIKEGNQLQKLFQKRLGPSTAPLINPFESIAAILQSKDFEAMKSSVVYFINIHSDVRDEHLHAIMDLKGCVKRKERKTILQLLQNGSPSTEEARFLFFDDITLGRRKLGLCCC